MYELADQAKPFTRSERDLAIQLGVKIALEVRLRSGNPIQWYAHNSQFPLNKGIPASNPRDMEPYFCHHGCGLLG